MNRRLTRGSNGDRMLSPEQLDQTMQVTGPFYWLVLVSVLIGLVAAVVWSLIGSIPTKAAGEGIVIRPGGVFNVFAGGTGFVKTFDVHVGDFVEAGETLAQIDQPTSEDDIQTLERRLNEVRDQTDQSLRLNQDTAKLQEQTFSLQRANDAKEVSEQDKLEKIASDEVATSQHLYEKGLVTHQVVVDAQQRLIAIQSSIGRLQVEMSQAASQAYQADWQPQEVKRQRQIEIHDIEAQLHAQQLRSRLTSDVVSPIAGQVIEEKTYTGAMIAAGAPIISIEPDDMDMTAVLYIPSTQAKEVKTGMEAEISPSTAKREEYGFIRGKVTFVSDYPATSGGMMTLFENDALVASLRGRGMVTEIDVTMERDRSTPSGFRWSSSRGPDTQITPGTLCAAQIITRSQKPISLVLPFLKRITGLH